MKTNLPGPAVREALAVREVRAAAEALAELVPQPARARGALAEPAESEAPAAHEAP